MSVRILFWSAFNDDLADVLDTLDGVGLHRVQSEADLADALPAADAMIMVGPYYTASVARLIRERGNRLRWIQVTTAGYEGIGFHGVPASVAVTNAGNAHASLVAEHAVTLLTAVTRRLPCFGEHQARHVFDQKIPLPLATLEDSTVAILGYGGIGREIARRVKAFDARIIVIARTARTEEFADQVVGSDALLDVLARSDALVVAAALTAETQGMIGAAAFAALKPSAVLVNVARGGIVDTMAMVEALNTGRLAGAGLDVTDPEPPPPDHPLWSCPNLIVTPHTASRGGPGPRPRITALIRQNVARFLAGQELAHRVA